MPKLSGLDGKISLSPPQQWQIWTVLSEIDCLTKYQRSAAYKTAAPGMGASLLWRYPVKPQHLEVGNQVSFEQLQGKCWKLYMILLTMANLSWPTKSVWSLHSTYTTTETNFSNFYFSSTLTAVCYSTLFQEWRSSPSPPSQPWPWPSPYPAARLLLLKIRVGFLSVLKCFVQPCRL